MNTAMVQDNGYELEAGRLCGEMLSVGADSSKLLDVLLKIRERGRNDDEIMDGIRQLHDRVMLERGR